MGLSGWPEWVHPNDDANIEPTVNTRMVITETTHPQRMPARRRARQPIDVEAAAPNCHPTAADAGIAEASKPPQTVIPATNASGPARIIATRRPMN